MDKIEIADLEVFYRVGVTDGERAQPQRLLLTIELTHDLFAAVMSDRITKTIDYNEVAQRLARFGEGRSWKLIEKLAANLADMILAEFRPESVAVQVKKFSVPQARHVSVTIARSRAG